jgi:hypothetical protein
MNYAEFSNKWKFDAKLFGINLREHSSDTPKSIRGACYLVVDDGGFLAYVGMSHSKGVHGRIKAHQEKRWFSKAYYIATDLEKFRVGAEVLEKSLIRMFKPYANKERYIAGADLHQDVWVLREYGIDHPSDWLLGEIKTPDIRPSFNGDYSIYRKPGDKPGDLSNRVARMFGVGA